MTENNIIELDSYEKNMDKICDDIKKLIKTKYGEEIKITWIEENGRIHLVCLDNYLGCWNCFIRVFSQ